MLPRLCWWRKPSWNCWIITSWSPRYSWWEVKRKVTCSHGKWSKENISINRRYGHSKELKTLAWIGYIFASIFFMPLKSGFLQLLMIPTHPTVWEHVVLCLLPRFIAGDILSPYPVYWHFLERTQRSGCPIRLPPFREASWPYVPHNDPSMFTSNI